MTVAGKTTQSTLISLRLPSDLLERIDRWRAAQPAPPTRTAIFRAALSEFLDRHE